MVEISIYEDEAKPVTEMLKGLRKLERRRLFPQVDKRYEQIELGVDRSIFIWDEDGGAYRVILNKNLLGGYTLKIFYDTKEHFDIIAEKTGSMIYNGERLNPLTKRVNGFLKLLRGNKE